jgi:glycosyltransferase involved in cell wall biosynthesis
MSHAVTDANAADCDGREQPTGELRAVPDAGPSKAPSVSVLMPVYNSERYVAQAVESILAQTFTDFEFLIVDDGSTDASRTILESYAARDARIQLVSRPNTGCLVALNEMLGRARGDLIARMDADDVAFPERFERQVAYLYEHPACVLVGSRVLIIDPDGDEITVMGNALGHEEIVDALLANQGQMVYHPAVMFRREAVMALGGYDVRMIEAEDLHLFLRLADVGEIVNLPEPLLKYREHLKKAGRARAERLEQYCRMILNEARERRNMGPLPEAGPGPRNAKDLVATPVQIYQIWAWWALQSGRLRTSRKYAWAGLVRKPLSRSSWKLLLCALRGY